MNIKRATLPLAAAALLTLVAACGSGNANASSGNSLTAKINFAKTPKGTLNAWAFNGADDVGKARMADVQKALKGVTIKYDFSPFDSSKFTTMLASGNVPDVIQVTSTDVPTYAAQGVIMPLDKCYSQNHVVPDQRFYKNIVTDVTYKGHVWGVPQFYQPNAIILNENVMKAAGVTNSEIDTSKPSVLLAAIKKMYKTSGGNPSVLGLDPVPTGQDLQWVIGLGGQLVGPDGKPTLNDPRNIYPLELLKQITDAQGGWAKVKSFTDSFDTFGANNQFVKNQVGAQVDAQWYPNVLSPYKNKINIQAVPFRGRNGQPVSVTSGEAFVIPAKAKNPVAACAYALRLTSEANWMAAEHARVNTLKQNGGINTGLFTGSPAVDQMIRSQYNKPSGNSGFDQVISTYYNVVADGKPVGASPAGEEIQQALLNAVTSTLLGQSSAKAALNQAQQQAMNAYNTVSH